MNKLDTLRLREALALAESAFGVTEPNPRVGCVLGHADGRVLGRGATQQVGGPHAEVMALRAAEAAGHDLRGATAWVTLEPCAHHGRTPPCCDALIAAGIARCVVAIQDPNPSVQGTGIARMRVAGLQVELVGDARLVAAAREINIGFLSRFERGRPWVRLKLAASLDGRSALPDGRSQWITGEAARDDGHRWRRRASAVLTGIGTVLADDPRLDVRAVTTAVQPLRVVLDSRLRTPPDASILRAPGKALIVACRGHDGAAQALRARGAEVWDDTPAGTPLSLDRLLARLADHGVNELHVEAGATLNATWLASGLVDEVLLYVAPFFIGPGRPIADLVELPGLDAAQRWHLTHCEPIGRDLRLLLRAQL
jgi:diaminohydroxyphosphoribosylaminopyrimidine deaminase/5-amino-6-(5-phosphoribosylamino)uracil reductase